MVEKDKKSLGKKLIEGIDKSSQEDCEDAWKKAEESEKNRTAWIAEMMQEDDKKKDNGDATSGVKPMNPSR